MGGCSRRALSNPRGLHRTAPLPGKKMEGNTSGHKTLDSQQDKLMVMALSNSGWPEEVKLPFYGKRDWGKSLEDWLHALSPQQLHLINGGLPSLVGDIGNARQASFSFCKETSLSFPSPWPLWPENYSGTTRNTLQFSRSLFSLSSLPVIQPRGVTSADLMRCMWGTMRWNK